MRRLMMMMMMMMMFGWTSTLRLHQTQR